MWSLKRAPDWLAVAFVWGVWAVLAAIVLLGIVVFSHNLPHGDDWDMVPYVTGETPLTWDWLWGLHGEHRLLLPKLVLYVLFTFTGDFRAGMYFNAIALATLAAALLLAVRRLRGWTAYPDAVLPLILLNPGNYRTLLWGLQVVFILPVMLSGMVFLLSLRVKGRLTWMQVLAAGTCILLLPLCGGPGLAFTPALAVGLGLAGAWQCWSAPPGERGPGLLALVFSANVAALIGLYLSGGQVFQAAQASPVAPLEVLTSALKYLTVSLGPVAGEIWPAGGLGVLAVVGVTLGMLAWSGLTRAQARFQAAALFVFSGTFLALVLALGKGRGQETMTFAEMMKYVTLLVFVPCWTYFAWLLLAPRAVGPFVHWGLLLVLAVTLKPNTEAALEYARQRHADGEAFLDDLYTGLAPYQLVRRHSTTLYPDVNLFQACTADFESWLPVLKKHQVGDFAEMADNPPFQEIEVPLKPISRYDVAWNNGVCRVTGEAPSIEFALPRPVQVAILRILFTDSAHAEGKGTWIQVEWKAGRGTQYPAERAYYQEPLLLDLERQMVYLYLEERVDRVRLNLDPHSGAVRLHGISVWQAVTPARTQPPAARR